MTPDGLARAEQVRERAGGTLAATLVRLGLIEERELARQMADLYALPLAATEPFSDPSRVDGINPAFLRRAHALPLASHDGRLSIAMADPSDQDAIAALTFAAEADVERQVATFSDIAEALVRATPDAEGAPAPGDSFSAGTQDDLDRLLDSDSDAPVIRLVQRLLANAVDRRASDVHIEPMARHLAIRYRIDGRLVEVERQGDALAAPIASRIKVMAALDIAETRLPQDGRLRLTVRGREVDVRVSTSPTAWGESIVLRLLGRSEVPLDLERLGLPANALATLTQALERPHGIILLTGPTGSGKTTTLYAALNRLRWPDVKILTVEDPVEVLLEGVNQVQTRPDIGLDFASTLRAFLRQDPDILMIGEIRDRETADIALRAALTGHLVLSTLHTNTAAGAFTRLTDIGIEPYLAASTVIATIAQRLIRTLCPDCKAARPPDPDQAARFLTIGLPVPGHICEPVGCPACQQSGYRGRAPLLEVLTVDETLREHIRTGDAEAHAALRPKADTLLGHGLSLVAEGRTSLAEVARAVELA